MSNFSALFLINGQVLCVFGSAWQEDDPERERSEFLDTGFFFKRLSLLKRSDARILRVKPPFLRGKGIQV